MIKHRINLGNCGNDLNSDLVPPTVIDQKITFDMTTITWDSTIITFDQT